jgi:toxin ParE1/3/4
MSYNLVIQTEAVLDLQEAFEWYEKKRKGLGYLLIEEIEISYQKLSENPHHYTHINQVYRRIKLNKFPYLIIYEIEGQNIIINSVRHAKRKSKF